MKLKNNWRQQSLETLENQYWGDPKQAATTLVKRCLELSKVPIEHFTLADLRIMIGQKFGLTYLMPIAIEKLQDDILVEAELYEGDLLNAVLNVDASFWDNNENYWKHLSELIKDRQQEIAELKINTSNFLKS